MGNDLMEPPLAAPIVRKGRRPLSSATLEDILSAARMEFAERGFDGAKVETIAVRAGISKQLIYYYFEDKSELYGIVLEEATRNAVKLAQIDDYDLLTAEPALVLFVKRMVDEYISRPAISRMIMDEALHNCDHVLSSSELGTVMRRIIDETLAPILRRGACEGVFRQDTDPHAFFWAIFSMVTVWSGHSALISRVSGERFQGDEGGRYWRSTNLKYILDIVRYPQN